jgi:aminotransferase
VFTDEIYEHITYDGREHISPAALPGAKERTITISGLSKTFSVTGWRLGYCACDARWAKLIGFMSDLVYVCPPTPLQYGAAEGLARLGEDYYSRLRENLRRKRDKLCGALSAKGLTPHVPQGAYYILADISRIGGRTGKERAMRLLRETKIACVPGEAFFSRPRDGYNLARFCYAKTDKELAAACAALRKWNA